MARVKLSEYDAKRLLFPAQTVFSATPNTKLSALRRLFSQQPLVVKVDQGVKKRGKQGLVQLGLTAPAVVKQIGVWHRAGWSQFLVEPVLNHRKADERYLSFTRTRQGWEVISSDKGGVEIESHWDSVHPVSPDPYQSLIAQLNAYHLTFLELNPYLKLGGQLIALDAAAEVDSAALSLADLPAEASAKTGLTPAKDRFLSPAELKVAALDAATPASLKFKLINNNGRIWMLLSGGGASLVLADEVADLGLGAELANYGEYSGAPTTDDTYAYTKIIIQQLLKSKITGPQAIVIAGGVANFTDVVKTFKGIIRALSEFAPRLKDRKVKVFVRRGGPNEEEGLAKMSEFLKSTGLSGSVHGSEIALTQVIREVKEYL